MRDLELYLVSVIRRLWISVKLGERRKRRRRRLLISCVIHPRKRRGDCSDQLSDVYDVHSFTLEWGLYNKVSAL